MHISDIRKDWSEQSKQKKRMSERGKFVKQAAHRDEGWAWVVALACFIINFIMAGLARTAGVLYVALIELYGVNREAATTPFSIRVSVRNLTGPIIGVLGQRYGIRPITTIGGLFAAVGGMLCFIAPDVFWITVFWGGIHGLGFGLSTILHMIAINHYFDKYKATALGLGYSGDCIGTFVFPIVMEMLLSCYGVRGTFLILGGIVLNVVPAALLLRPAPWILSDSQRQKALENKSHKQKSSPLYVIECSHRLSCDNHKPLSFTQKHNECISSSNSFLSESSQIRKSSLSFHDKVLNKGCKCDLMILSSATESVNVGQNDDSLQKNSAAAIFASVFRVNIKPMFLLISLTMAVYAFLFVSVLTVIIDFGIDRGISREQGKYLVIGFSAADLVGRISFGWIIDKRLILMRTYVTLTVAVMGIIVATLPMSSTFVMIMSQMSIYGLVQGGTAIMFPILISSYMKSEEESIAMGSMNLYGGILMIGMAPMIGFFRDNFGSYDGLFYIVGGLSFVIGMLWLLEPFIIMCQNRKSESKTVNNTDGMNTALQISS